MNRIAGTILILAVVCVLGCRPAQDASVSQETPARVSPPVDQRAAVTSAAVSLTELTGAEPLRERLAAKKGKVVVVDYWATWCPPCMAEFHNLIDLQQKYPEHLACVSVSCDYDGLAKMPEVRERVTRFLSRYETPVDHILITQEADPFFQDVGIQSLPVVEVYDTTGELQKRFDASTPGDQLYPHVRQLVDSSIHLANGTVPTFSNVPYGPHERCVLDLWQATGDGPHALAMTYSDFRAQSSRSCVMVWARRALWEAILISIRNNRLLVRTR